MNTEATNLSSLASGTTYAARISYMGLNMVSFCFRYAYPPPDGNILTNIVNALIAVPRFYTQVVSKLMLSVDMILWIFLLISDSCILLVYLIVSNSSHVDYDVNFHFVGVAFDEQNEYSSSI